MRTSHPIRVAEGTTGFLLFTLAYYAPYLPEQLSLAVRDSRVQILLSSALTVPAVQVELLRDLGGHLLLLALCYLAIAWMGVRFARATGVRASVACLLFLTTAWLLLVSGNGLLFPLSDYSVAFDAVAHPGVFAAAVLVFVTGSIVAFWHAFRRRRLVAGLVLAGIIGVSVGAGHWSSAVPVAGDRKSVV